VAQRLEFSGPDPGGVRVRWNDGLGRSWLTIDPELWALPVVCDRQDHGDIINHSVHQGVRETGNDFAPDLTPDQGRRFGIVENLVDGLLSFDHE
jgi:hypothetical protein